MATRFYLDENVAERLAVLLLLLEYDAISTTAVGNKGATDAIQLLFALHQERVFLTYNLHDFELIHETLRLWSQEWDMPNARRHAGVLLFPDPGRLATADAAKEIDQFVSSTPDLSNRFFSWESGVGWIEIA